MGALNSMYTVGVGVACAAFVTTELCLDQQELAIASQNLVCQCISFGGGDGLT